MKCRATIKLKIQNRKEISRMFSAYLKACQYSADSALKNKCKTKFDLHHVIYNKIRKKFGLKSQFTINAIAKGFETYKSCKKKVVFKSVPLRFDRRTFSFFENYIRITTDKERINIPIFIPEYHRKYLSWNYQTADLVMNRSEKIFLNITFSRNVESIRGNSIVGVDLGINNLAVCSNGKVFKGEKTKIKQFHYLRRKLQAKGTKSARRILKRISGRQKRYMAWINHNVSRQIVDSADIIVLENLKGIRKCRNKYRGKRLNRWLNGWSFYQLQNFIQYKASFVGKKTAFINPHMTSKTCSNCGNIGSRCLSRFVCSDCGFSCDADFNASCTLRRLYVNQPNVSDCDAKAPLGELKRNSGTMTYNVNNG
ncbi:transposase [Candidatus Woesearchaeota archaeon]|nr:transposase [Candidatus Woesearchaeota archaeon]